MRYISLIGAGIGEESHSRNISIKMYSIMSLCSFLFYNSIMHAFAPGVIL